MLKRKWKTLLISSIVFLITFFQSSAFIESFIWTKWGIIFSLCPFIYLYLLYFCKKKHRIKIDIFYLLVSVFSAALLIKSLLEGSFVYYSWYIVCFWGLYSFFYFNKVSKKLLYNIFTSIILILSIAGFIQYFNGYKFITGTFDNPAGYSSSLVLLLPFLFHLYFFRTHNNRKKWIYAVISIMAVAAIILSESRTAIIALTFIATFFVPIKYKRITYSFLLLLFCFLIFFVKNDSTIGRYFILKTACSMINAHSLIWGYGFGGFKANYMVFQAKSFEKSPNNEYAILADNIFHPLNEFILFFIEHGVIFFIGCIIILSIYIIKVQRQTPQYYCVIAIFIFSLFSYPFKYPLTLLMLAYALSFLKLHRNITFSLNIPTYIIASIASIIWLGYIVHDIKNNYLWSRTFNKTKLGQFYKVKDTYTGLSTEMKNNANFMFNYSSILFRYGHYHESLSNAKECLCLIDNYDIQLLLADNYYKLNNYKLAIQHYQKASFMCPNRFAPLYGIFLTHISTNNISQAIESGHAILTKEIKVKSKVLHEILLDVQEKMDSLE